MTRRSIIGTNSSTVDENQRVPAAGLLPPQVIYGQPTDFDENDSVTSSVSSLSQDEELRAPLQSMHSPQSTRTTKLRSIFGTYWMAEGECPPKQLLPPRPLSPRCVTKGPHSHQYYSPTMEELLVQQALEEEDDDDLNTYERTLKECEEKRLDNWRKMNPLASPFESPPLWFTWIQTKTRSQSARSLPVRDLTRLGGTLTRCRQIQSDSALHTKPPTSVLRQGRFGKKTQQTTTGCASNAAAATSRHVHFQARIQIHSYQPPMESWASEGWSQWFGS